MPHTSIIVPCYNEEATIGLLLEAIYRQTYPKSQLEVIIVDGQSTDRTRQRIDEFHETHLELEIRLVDNPKRMIPSALNIAIQDARGQYIIRLDGHSMPYPDYVERCIAALETGQGANVGGIWEIRPGKGNRSKPGVIARSIAAAAAHPLGVGDAFYRFADRSGPVDTVPFGAFRRDLVEKIGGFDETLQANEDYEFNVRVRKSGGTVWLDPSIRSVYFTRSTLGALLRQYWKYGYWKARMLRRYPRTLRWRQALPPLFVASLLLLGLASVAFPWARGLLLFELSIYLLALIVVGLQVAFEKRDAGLFFGTPVAIAGMHLAWGSGLLWSLITSIGNVSKQLEEDLKVSR